MEDHTLGPSLQRITSSWFYGKSFEWQRKEQRKMQHWEKCLRTTWTFHNFCSKHYNDVIMTMMASQITSLTIVYSTVYSNADQRKHQSSASLAFVRGIHWDRWIPRTKGQLRGKCFHWMTSSWNLVSVDNIFLKNVFFCNTLDPWEVRRNIDKNANILIEENAFENVVYKMTAILSRTHFNDYILHFQ